MNRIIEKEIDLYTSKLYCEKDILKFRKLLNKLKNIIWKESQKQYKRVLIEELENNLQEKEKFECFNCGCYFWVNDRNNFNCPNCEGEK